MKTKSTLAAALAAAVLALPSANAALMTYTETGYLSGSLGGTSFTNSAVTLRVTTDTVNVTYALVGGAIPLWSNAGVTTIDIVGFETATFNGGNVFGVFSQNLSAYQPGTAAVGIGDLTRQYAVLGNIQTTELNYALATESTFTGAASVSKKTYSTTLGNLILTGTSGNATFTAAAAVVPEPSAFALLGLGTVGLALRRRR